MRAFLPICCLLSLLVSSPLSAQIIDRSLSFGFLNLPQVVRPMGGNKWLTVGRAVPYGPHSDTIFAIIFDQQGQILLQKTLLLPFAETYFVSDAWPLADGGFVVSFGAHGCGFGDFTHTVQKYSLDGQLLWTLQGVEENAPPPVWQITPDGNLLGLGYNRMWKVDANSGSIMWQAALQNLNGHPPPAYIDLIPNTEDFLGMGLPMFQIWKKIDSTTGPVYVQQDSLHITGPRHGLGFAPNGWHYCRNYNTQRLERVSQGLEYEALNNSIDLYGLVKMIAVSDGLYFLGRRDGQNWLRKTDFLGQNPVEIAMPDQWLSGYSLAAQGDALAVAGVDISGPKSDLFLFNPQFEAMQLWIRTYSNLAAVSSIDTTNAAITNLQQLSAIDTMYLGIYGDVFLQGCDFQVQITNRGNTILQQVNVNFTYEKIYLSCYNVPARQRLYTNLQLAPGESTWVSFGNFNIVARSLLSEFCF